MSGESSSRGLPLRFESPPGMRLEVSSNGAIRRMDHADITINLFLGSEIEGGPTNIYRGTGGFRRNGTLKYTGIRCMNEKR